MHDAGKGVIGMKILAEGAFKEPERRDASLRFVLGLGTVNAFIIGFESPEQVDDLIKRTGRRHRRPRRPQAGLSRRSPFLWSAGARSRTPLHHRQPQEWNDARR